jgi:hypothetical protein
MKKFFIILALLIIFSGCGGGGALRSDEGGFRAIREQGAGEGFRGRANLNLPLITRDNTVYQSHNITFFITEDGVMKRAETGFRGTEIIDVAENVRSLEIAMHGQTVFFVTNENELWGYGDNQNGILGDATGVNRSEAVLIMENVAGVYGFSGPHVMYAIKTDKTLWTWGNGNFEPTFVAGDVVRVFGGIYWGTIYYQTSGGGIYLIYGGEIERVLPEPAYDILVGFGHNATIFINSERALIRRTISYGPMYEEISTDEQLATNVERIIQIDQQNLFFLKTDNTLWGMGENRLGELGDGTKVPRETPVQIAENISGAWNFAYLTQEGTFFTWNQNNPTPHQTERNVAVVFHLSLSNQFGILLQNGRYLRDLSGNSVSAITNVITPQERTW